MNCISRVLALCCVLSVSYSAQAQTKGFKGKPIEAGLFLGGSNYMGDLTPSIAFGETHLAGGLICRFNYSDFLTLRGNAVFGQISGDDKNYGDMNGSADEAFRYQRNLSFRSNVMEISAIAEWNLAGFGETMRDRPSSPYLFAGVGIFKFNPLAQFNYMPDVTDAAGYKIHDPQLEKFDGQWIELQTLATEGQETTKFNDRRRYPLTQICIPIGIGYKAQFDDYWAIGMEFGIRQTFTDYLDDISKDYVDEAIVGGNNGLLAAALADRSPELGYTKFEFGTQRGDNSRFDRYMFFGLTLTRKIVGGKTVCFQF